MCRDCGHALEDWIFSLDYADRSLREHFRLLTLDGCGLGAQSRWRFRRRARFCIICATRRNRRSIIWIGRRFTTVAESMILDAVTVRNLELLEPLFAGESRESTLIHVLDQTCTGMGGRMLRARLLRPCLQLDEIEARLDAVQAALRSHYRAIGNAQTARECARPGAAAGEVDAGNGGPARAAGAGTIRWRWCRS